MPKRYERISNAMVPGGPGRKTYRLDPDTGTSAWFDNQGRKCDPPADKREYRCKVCDRSIGDVAGMVHLCCDVQMEELIARPMLITWQVQWGNGISEATAAGAFE